MKYHMRRSERQIEEWAVIEEILREGKYATLALCRNNEPYIVTLNYGYDPAHRSLYFHCAKKGMKTDFVTGNPDVCAMVIQDKGYLQNECEHAYRSVVIRGRVDILTEENEKRKAIDVLLNHLEERPEIMRAKLRDRTEKLKAVQIWRLVIKGISGKEGS
jgi:nitroimidazol reductase NimA-like FMN-containing flavoprotein (pyridoxamine 5'-phosphate oxidase superfamily)